MISTKEIIMQNFILGFFILTVTAYISTMG